MLQKSRPQYNPERDNILLNNEKLLFKESSLSSSIITTQTRPFVADPPPVDVTITVSEPSTTNDLIPHFMFQTIRTGS